MIIYWANSIFSDADRNFNELCVGILRREGFTVLSPQDNPFNKKHVDITANEVFLKDTEMIKMCDVFIACIDQETIDSGVACETGIAWAENKNIIGLYTDFRQFRKGEGRMYKNPYVVGCIESKGRIVSNMDELIKELRNV